VHDAAWPGLEAAFTAMECEKILSCINEVRANGRPRPPKTGGNFPAARFLG
jgi:hypothetical protein